MNKAPLFILASASPRRLDLLASAGIKPDMVLPADIDETPLKNELPHIYAKRLAGNKAGKISTLHPDDIILAADTVVACGKRILPKADDEKSARFCLKLLSGKRHRVYTAIAVARGEKIDCAVVMTMVQFARLLPSDIEYYIASGQWQGKAGGYAIQGLAEIFITRINGSFSNVVGLPLARAKNMLHKAGLKIW